MAEGNHQDWLLQTQTPLQNVEIYSIIFFIDVLSFECEQQDFTFFKTISG